MSRWPTGQFEATDLRNGTIAATLQEFGYLITKGVVIDRQTAYVGLFFTVDKKKTSVARLNIGLYYPPENTDFALCAFLFKPVCTDPDGRPAGHTFV
jgi:hypothetical protein